MVAGFGFSPQQVLAQTLIAPSCGTGSLPIDLAKKVIESDKVVNKFNRSNFKFFSGDYDLEDSENATHFQKIFISKSIERIADHAKNLGEEVIYLLTGN